MIIPTPARSFLEKNTIYFIPGYKGLHVISNYKNYGGFQIIEWQEINTKTWELKKEKFECSSQTLFDLPYLPVDQLYRITETGAIYRKYQFIEEDTMKESILDKIKKWFI